MFAGLNLHVKQVETLSWTLDTEHLNLISSNKAGDGEWVDTFEIPQDIVGIFTEHDLTVSWDNDRKVAKVFHGAPKGIGRIIIHTDPETGITTEVIPTPDFLIEVGDTFHFGGTIKPSLKKGA